MYAETRRSSLYARLISLSADLNGANKLDPTYRIVIFNPRLPVFHNSFELIFKVTTDFTQSINHAIIDIPITTTISFQ